MTPESYQSKPCNALKPSPTRWKMDGFATRDDVDRAAHNILDQLSERMDDKLELQGRDTAKEITDEIAALKTFMVEYHERRLIEEMPAAVTAEMKRRKKVFWSWVRGKLGWIAVAAMAVAWAAQAYYAVRGQSEPGELRELHSGVQKFDKLVKP